MIKNKITSQMNFRQQNIWHNTNQTHFYQNIDQANKNLESIN